MNRTNVKTVWLPEVMAFAVGRSAENKSAREIAILINRTFAGYAITRNAVISIWHRENIPHAKKPTRAPGAMFPHKPRKLAKPRIRFIPERQITAQERAAKYRECPIADIGVGLMHRREDGCCAPVARDPQDKSQRFCGARRMSDGGAFLSSYCHDHHVRFHLPLCEAA